nr:uncharacterized protein LOC119178410 isoform X1 [Rhipicephalus microplus]
MEPRTFIAKGIPLYISLFSVALCMAWAKPRDHYKDDVPDAFKIFRDHAYGVTILDSDGDGELECMTTKRTEYNPEAPSATFVWILKGLNGHEKKNIPFHVRPSNSSHEVLLNFDDDNRDRILTVLYTDYKDCVVLEMPLLGKEECMLVVTREVKDAVPQHCFEHYDSNCYNKVTTYDPDVCSQVEDDF